MGWRDGLAPARMARVAVVAPSDQLRPVLVAVADAGVVQLERLSETATGPAAAALDRARQRLGAAAPGEVSAPQLAAGAPDLPALEHEQRVGELAGEAEMERARSAALRHGAVTALVGWCPAAAVGPLADRLEPLGGTVVGLRAPDGVEPPTLVEATGATSAFQPLVDGYATLPYADLNPSAFAGVAYVVMFGMMFGDVGHGALVLAAGALLSSGRPRSLARLRRLAPFVIGAGLASIAFGLVFGEAFGPTHLVPTLWRSPLSDPTTLLVVAVVVGAVLLGVAYGIGTVNRWREGGAGPALVATSGLAGATAYLGLATVVIGLWRHCGWAAVVGAVLAATGIGLNFLGYYAQADAGPGGVLQAGVEVFDSVLRIGTNTVSFARLAAFGLTHAALCGLVWSGTTGLWHRGPALWVPAAVLFVVGNALAFALEGLVAGVQALRLDYYELFSRIFVSEGQRFRPWHVPTLSAKEASCSPG